MFTNQWELLFYIVGLALILVPIFTWAVCTIINVRQRQRTLLAQKIFETAGGLLMAFLTDFAKAKEKKGDIDKAQGG